MCDGWIYVKKKIISLFLATRTTRLLCYIMMSWGCDLEMCNFCLCMAKCGLLVFRKLYVGSLYARDDVSCIYKKIHIRKINAVAFYCFSNFMLMITMCHYKPISFEPKIFRIASIARLVYESWGIMKGVVCVGSYHLNWPTFCLFHISSRLLIGR